LIALGVKISISKLEMNDTVSSGIITAKISFVRAITRVKNGILYISSNIIYVQLVKNCYAFYHKCSMARNDEVENLINAIYVNILLIKRYRTCWML